MKVKYLHVCLFAGGPYHTGDRRVAGIIMVMEEVSFRDVRIPNIHGLTNMNDKVGENIQYVVIY